MSILESLLYGFISGFAEFLPISPQGQQSVLMQLFGMSQRNPLTDLLIHIAAVASLLVGCRSMFIRLYRENLLISRGRGKRTYDFKGIYDMRLIRTAVIPMLLGLILYYKFDSFEFRPLLLALMLVINGVLIMIPEYSRQANKTSRSMTGVDGILLGMSAALSAFPGISRFGAFVGVSLLRGADRKQAMNWALLISIPALVFFIIYDLIGLFTIGAGALSFLTVLGMFLAAGAAFCGGYLAIVFIRFLTEHSGYTGFAYYSWGTALFSFVLFLIA